MNEKLFITIQILNEYKEKSQRQLANGTMQICHVPHVGIKAWLHILYKGLSKEQIEFLDKSIPIELPEFYKEFLSEFNGLNLFSNSLSICGLRSLNYRTGDDSIQPYSIIDLNSRRPAKCPDTWLYFGSYSWDGSSLVYDIIKDRIYRCERYSTNVLNEWLDFWTFLLSETQRLAKMFDENGVEYNEDVPTTP